MNKAQLDAMIASIGGPIIAEARKAAEAAGRKAFEEMHGAPQRKYGPALCLAASQEKMARLATSGDALREKSIDEMDDNERTLMAARSLRFMSRASNNAILAAELADASGEKTIAKALSESLLDAGGSLVPVEFASALIPLLRAKTVVRAAGTTTMPMNNGSLSIPFQSGAATAGYGAENANITKSEQTFGDLNLSNKKLTALVPASNDLLSDSTSGVAADRVIRDDLVKVMANREDLAFIRGDGAEGEPRGIKSWADSISNTDSAQALGGTDPDADLILVTEDLMELQGFLEDENLDLMDAVYIMHPRSKRFLWSYQTSNAQYAFRDEMNGGRVLGVKFAVTTAVPKNLGSGSNESEVHIFDPTTCVIADNKNVEIKAFDGGAYYDGSAMQSGISRDQTVFRAIAKHDFGDRQRGKACAYLSAVKWGL